MFNRRASRQLLQQLAPESRPDISRSYWRQLLEMVDTGEISLELARKIESDMFEPRSAREPPNLNEKAWQLYLSERYALTEIALARATKKPGHPPLL